MQNLQQRWNSFVQLKSNRCAFCYLLQIFPFAKNFCEGVPLPPLWQVVTEEVMLQSRHTLKERLLL